MFRGSDEKERPINLTFDWEKKRVTGVAKERAVDLELPDGAQDAMSLQIASLRNLASGKLQGHGVDDRRRPSSRTTSCISKATRRIDTALGELDTVIYTSKRAGAERLTRTWVAPALGYLPVKAERIAARKSSSRC